MLDYVKHLWRATQSVTPARGYAYFSDQLRHQAPTLGLKPIRASKAYTKSFDLILLADHEPSRFDPYAIRIRCPHGPVSRVRHVSDWSYYYDRARLYWLSGRPVYSVMFEVSREVANEARSRLPEYRHRLAVVGDARTAQFTENRSSINQTEKPPIVAVMSTWGPHGLIERHGHWLLPAIRDVAHSDKFRFKISVHPNVWSGRRSTRDWQDELMRLGQAGDKIKILSPADDWTVHFADCSLAVSDHTSLAASFAVGGYPILPVSVPAEEIGRGTFFAALTEAISPLTHGDDFEFRLSQLSMEGMPDWWGKVPNRFVPDSNNTQHLLRETLRNLLH